MSNARLPRRAPSRRAGRRRASRCATLTRCAVWFSSPPLPPSSPTGGEHWKRIAAAFDWQGVVLPANFRVDAWVTPPAYTGKPPIILAGIHPGETARQTIETNEPVSVPAGSTLTVRATGKLDLDVSSTGGVAAAKEDVRAPAGAQEYRFKIAAHRHRDVARRRRRSDLGLQRHSRQAADDCARQGSRAAKSRLAAVVLPARRRLWRDRSAGDIRAQRRAERGRRSRASALRAAGFRAGAAAGAHQERRRPDHQGSDRSSVGRRRSGDDAGRPRRRRQRGQERAVHVPPARARLLKAAGAGAGRAAPQSRARCRRASAGHHRARCARDGAGKVHA